MGFTPSMKNLIRIISLTLTVFFGSVGTSWGADFNKGLAAAQSGDFATALSEWTPLAKQGDADAQFSLGVMYEKGEGVARDNKAAVKWYTLAAEQGLADAQFNLGVMYANGTGVIKDNIHQGIPRRIHTRKCGEHRILRLVLALCRLGLGVGLPRILPVLTEASK